MAFDKLIGLIRLAIPEFPEEAFRALNLIAATNLDTIIDYYTGMFPFELRDDIPCSELPRVLIELIMRELSDDMQTMITFARCSHKCASVFKRLADNYLEQDRLYYRGLYFIDRHEYLYVYHPKFAANTNHFNYHIGNCNFMLVSGRVDVAKDDILLEISRSGVIYDSKTESDEFYSASKAPRYNKHMEALRLYVSANMGDILEEIRHISFMRL